MSINDLVTEVQSLTHEMRNRVETIESEQKRLNDELASKSGQVPAEYKSSIDKFNARIDELTDLVQKLQIEAQRPPAAEPEKKDHAARAAFVKAMKKGGDLSRLSNEEKALIVPDYMPAERKALYASDATTGGFFAATDYVEELMAYKQLISPVRQIARVQRTSGEKVQMPALANDTTAYWAVEHKSYLDSQDPTLAMLNIPVHELRGMLKISQQNLEDSMFNLESFIKERLGIQFAQKEGAAFLNGDGNGKPRGILSYPIKASASYAGGSAGKNNVTDAIAYVPSGTAGAITPDSVLTPYMDLKSTYAPNATYCLTRSTLGIIRLFKDTMQRPLWQPFASGGLPATIYDRPYIEMPDMPEVGAGTFPILVGDFSYYMVVDRVTLNMQQLNELFAIQSLVGFIARARVGGDVLLPEAFRVVKASVS